MFPIVRNRLLLPVERGVGHITMVMCEFDLAIGSLLPYWQAPKIKVHRAPAKVAGAPVYLGVLDVKGIDPKDQALVVQFDKGAELVEEKGLSNRQVVFL